MTRSNLTFRFDSFAVADQGSVSDVDLNTIRSPKGSTARVNENAVLTQELLARTNPFRSEFSIPVAMKELVDMGTLFKLSAKSFANLGGSAYLNYKFGWQQFHRDVQALHAITKTIESRIKEIKSLSKHGGVRRKIKLQTTRSNYSESNRPIQSAYNVSVRADVAGTLSCEIHGTVRWRWKPGFDVDLEKLQYFNIAVAKVFDLESPDPQTVWELIPWSWLADYFVGLSSYFGAHLGEDIIEPYDICIVRRTITKYQFSPVSKPSSITLSGSGQFGMTEYDRDVVTRGSFPAVRTGFLSRNQILIIAALIASFKR